MPYDDSPFSLNNPYDREVYANDFLAGRTVYGTWESIPYLTKKRAFVSNTKRKAFDGRAFLTPMTPEERAKYKVKTKRPFRP